MIYLCNEYTPCAYEKTFNHNQFEACYNNVVEYDDSNKTGCSISFKYAYYIF